MSILISQRILAKIKEELSKSSESFTLISAYCKLPLVQYFEECIANDAIQKKLIVRLRADDILSGASDLEIYPFCRDHHWDLYFRLDLHAKTYIFDNLRCIVGSANATSSGLSIGGIGNYEMASVSSIEADDLVEVRQLFCSSVKMTDEIYEQMANLVATYKKSDLPIPDIQWPKNITDLFHPDYAVLFSEDFPYCSEPENASADDLLFLNILPTADFQRKKDALEQSKCYQWLRQLIEQQTSKEMYFGAITAELHNTLLNDPKPYRRDVKMLLANLLNWITYYNSTDLVVDRPNHSQRVALRTE